MSTIYVYLSRYFKIFLTTFFKCHWWYFCQILLETMLFSIEFQSLKFDPSRKCKCWLETKDGWALKFKSNTGFSHAMLKNIKLPEKVKIKQENKLIKKKIHEQKG